MKRSETAASSTSLSFFEEKKKAHLFGTPLSLCFLVYCTSSPVSVSPVLFSGARFRISVSTSAIGETISAL